MVINWVYIKGMLASDDWNIWEKKERLNFFFVQNKICRRKMDEILISESKYKAIQPDFKKL